VLMFKRLIALVGALLIVVVSLAVQASKSESGSFVGPRFGRSQNPCANSTFDQTCPSHSNCFCLDAEGTVSGEPIGRGYAEVDFNVDGPIMPAGCSDYNASMFIIASGDLQELDFSGALCSGNHETLISGQYQIATSSNGYVGAGTIKGRTQDRLT